MTELEERLWLMDLLKKRTGFLVKLDGQLVNALLEWRDNSANAEVARLTKALEGIRDCRFTWEMASNVDTLQDIARTALSKGE